jgi:hypothetical protein
LLIASYWLKPGIRSVLARETLGCTLGVGVGVYKLFCAELRHLRRSFEDFLEKIGYRKIQHKMQRSESRKCGTLNTVFDLSKWEGGGGSFLLEVLTKVTGIESL